MKLTSVQSFIQSLNAAEARIDNVIGSKLESFFELAEYNWMPPRPQSAAGEPSTYVFEMITFLTAYVDSVLIGLNEEIKTRAYRNALLRINRWLMVSRTCEVSVDLSGFAMRKRCSEVQRACSRECLGRCQVHRR